MKRLTKYRKFVRNKVPAAPMTGFEVDKSEINPLLKPHQQDIVQWNILGGCRGIFIIYGLGKTVIQLETLRLIKKHKGGKVLVVCPLGVRSQFQHDCKMLGMTMSYVTCIQEAEASDADIIVTNYERVRNGQVELAYFTAVTLDEGDVLRTDNSITHHEFIRQAKNVKYKFVATATPTPNEFIEMIFYAAFLGIMDKNQAKTRFFKRDSSKADNLTILPGKEKEFWQWCRSWGIYLEFPSDLGYSDEGYILPKMNVYWDCIPVDHSTAGFDENGQGKLYRDAALGLSDAAREKQWTMNARVQKMTELLKEYPGKNVLLWHDLEKERHAIQKAVPECKIIYGTQDMDIREALTDGFANGEFQYLATKPCISGAGTNFQWHCSTAIFLGVGFKFRDAIQAVHRIYRYMQTEEVDIRFIYAESEEEIVNRFKEKWRRHDELRAQMRALIRKYGLSNADEIRMGRTIQIDRVEKKGMYYTVVQNDCVNELSNMPENHLHFWCTSIPFAIQYEYTNSYFDFGHNLTNEKFFEQMDFLIPEMLRTLQPGRICAVHVKDRVIPGNFSGLGMYSLYPFSDETVRSFCKHGFIFMGRITIATDVVRENNQTYRLSYSEMLKDSTKMAAGVPEYVLLFRKLPTDTCNSYADNPVVKKKEDYTLARWQLDAHGFWRSDGNRFLTEAEMSNLSDAEIQDYFKRFSRNVHYDFDKHVAISEDLENKQRLSKKYMTVAPESVHPDVWTDVTRVKTLNTIQAKHNRDQHICPLPWDVVDRLILRFTNPDEIVGDPFSGLGTVPYLAVKLGRCGWGAELNPISFNESINHLEEADLERQTPTLFDVSKY